MVRVSSIIRKYDIDVVHGNETIPAFIGGGAARLARRGRAVYNRQHLCDRNFVREERPRMWLLSRLAGRLNHGVLACSQASAKYAVDQDHVPASRVWVGYNGANDLRSVSAHELETMRKALGISNASRVISVVSRLRPVKGLKDLIYAIQVLEQRSSVPIALVIAGDGPDRQELERLSREVAPGTVRFVGNQDDVAPWFRLGDIVALPSHYEAFGVAAIEAMACGRPVVASNVGGLSEVVLNDETGLLHTPRDVLGIADALAALLSDPARAARMGELARKRFETHFTIRAMVDGWFTCYRELCNS